MALIHAPTLRGGVSIGSHGDNPGRSLYMYPPLLLLRLLIGLLIYLRSKRLGKQGRNRLQVEARKPSDTQ